MQMFNPFSDDMFLRDSHSPLINNLITLLSQSSGTVFPTTNLYVGRPCFRSDQLKLYVAIEVTPVVQWRLLFDFSGDKSPTSTEALATAVSSLTALISQTDTGTRGWVGGAFLPKDGTAQNSTKFNNRADSEFPRKAESDSNITASWSFKYGITGGFGTLNGSANEWAASVWSLGDSYKGGAAGNGWRPTNFYGAAWVRGGHSNASGSIGEGIYVYQDGNLVAGMGSSGGYVASGFTVGGSMYAYGNVSAYSDIRLKENIELIPDALDRICKLRGVTFDRVDRAGRDLPRQMGTIADEVQEEFPELVSDTPSGYKAVAYGNFAGPFIEAFKVVKSALKTLLQDQKELREEVARLRQIVESGDAH